jgi:hypothetical protein
VVARLEKDRSLAPDIDAMAEAIRSHKFDAWCEQRPRGIRLDDPRTI